MSVTKENLAPPPDGNIYSVLQTSGLPWWLSGKESAADFCSTDYAKSFDCVDHNKLWKILKEMGIPDHMTCS